MIKDESNVDNKMISNRLRSFVKKKERNQNKKLMKVNDDSIIDKQIFINDIQKVIEKNVDDHLNDLLDDKNANKFEILLSNHETVDTK